MTQAELTQYLIGTDAHFSAMYRHHRELDEKIAKHTGPRGTGCTDTVVAMKKMKLSLKQKMEAIKENHLNASKIR